MRLIAAHWHSATPTTGPLELPETFFDVPVLWVHGHTHQPFNYQVRSCQVVCNPRGYVNWSGRIENKAFDPALIIDVEPSAIETARGVTQS